MNNSETTIRYSMLIHWSNEDDAFLVTLPDWEGRVINPITHGDTYEEAVQYGRLALEDLIAVSLESQLPLPEVKPVEIPV